MKMRVDMRNSAAEMLEAAGIKNITTYDNMPAPGFCIHEMGTARMGKDPKTSVLNKWNQMHDAKNVFITDGSAMASSACQNPSLTYMALTARATDFAVSELKKEICKDFLFYFKYTFELPSFNFNNLFVLANITH